MWHTRAGAAVRAVELAAALLLATAVSDALGFPTASFYLLVVGVPIMAAAGLVCFGHVVDAVNGGRIDALGRLQAILSALLVGAIVLGAAMREPALGEGTVPPEATGTLAFGFGLLALQAVLTLASVRR